MSTPKAKPQQPARAKSKAPAKSPKTKATASASLEKSEPGTASRKKTSTSRDVRSALRGTKLSGDADQNQELRQVQSLLAQIWHRNKNQHRGQKWWKWVAVLKRCVRDLVELVGAGGGGSRVKVKNGEEGLSEADMVRRRMERDRARRERREQVEGWLREVVLGRCWLAFSTLIADRQFSTLGVVLLAILARVGKVVGLPEPAPPTVSDVRPGQHTNTILATSLTQAGVDTGEVVERVFDGRELEDSGLVVSREGRMALMATMIKDGEAGKQSGKGNFLDTEPIRGEDEGVTESLMASADDGEPGKGAQSTSEALAHGGLADKPPAVAERKRKRRKKGNAIDELFAGLP